MYWSDDPEDPDMCAGPPYMDEVQMKFPSLADQKKDGESLYSWFREVIRMRNAYPALAGGKTERAASVCDNDVAAFFRRSETDKDLLIVMNLRGQMAEKDLRLPQVYGVLLCRLHEPDFKSVPFRCRSDPFSLRGGQLTHNRRHFSPHMCFSV